MSIYTTPLQFGYFLALLMAILFWVRGYREERLSDKKLGCVLFLLGMEIQDYTFGFAGINVLCIAYLNLPIQLIIWCSYIYYFTLSLRLYWEYREWAKNQFSDQDLISFTWFRNLIYFMIFGILFKESMGMIDRIFNLDFYQDWWWNLAMAAIIFYVGIWGYSQVQPGQIEFDTDESTGTDKNDKALNEDLEIWKRKIQDLMEAQKPYLESQLSLKSLALKLKTNPSVLSAAIIQNFKKNFNDFVNEYRVQEYLTLSNQSQYDHYTLLALAMECGFNSKSTFNRAFKKNTGRTPKEMKNDHK